MNSLDFHNNLMNLSNCKDYEELIEKVLVTNNANSIKNASQKVSKIIENFLKDNENQINQTDIAALRNLAVLVEKLEVVPEMGKDSGKSSTLKKVVNTSIILASNNLTIAQLNLQDNLDKIRSIQPPSVRFYVIVKLIERDQPSIESLALLQDEIKELIPHLVILEDKEFVLNIKAALLCKLHNYSFDKYKSFMSKYDDKIDGDPAKDKIPLFEAAENSKFSIIFDVLLELGANKEAALSLATKKKKVSVINLLCASGADVNKCNNDGLSPLMIAAGYNYVDVVKFLIQNWQANVNQSNKDGYSPLHFAVSNERAEMIELLKNLGADLNLRDNEGRSPLFLAVSNKSSKVIELLNNLGADLNLCDKDGCSPLFIAALNGDSNIVELLKTLGADVNKGDNKGNTPFLIAVYDNNMEMVQLLKRLGALVNKSNNIGMFPLLETLESRNIQMAQLLEQMGGDRKSAEQIHIIITLCHLWGLRGIYSIGEFTFNVEGTCSSSWALDMLSENVNELFLSETIIDKNGIPLISKEDQALFQETITNAFPLSKNSSAETIEKIKAQKPVVILGGSFGHKVSIVIGKNQIALFNRGFQGDEDDAAIFLTCSTLKIEEEVIEGLQKTYDTMDEFFDFFKKISKDLDMKYLKGFQQKDQKVGNCVWASTKGIFAVLCEMYTNEHVRKKLYKELTFLARKRILKDAISKGEFIDKIIIEQIRRKCINKKGRWLELLPMIQDYKIFNKKSSIQHVHLADWL